MTITERTALEQRAAEINRERAALLRELVGIGERLWEADYPAPVTEADEDGDKSKESEQ